ncbi:MAG: aminoacyl-histidine dipeptidase [Bacteroidaceae bacterium]|nr:aminoacyl-histidine dipeptidase [Bacteroidaceae bacterium]
MSEVKLTPKAVFDYFHQINAVPRPSKHEEKMIEFLKNFAAEHGLPCKVDKVGNVLISKPATPGKENVPGLILQGHMDMVCEKVSGLDFDFEKQPIETYIDGEWMRAKGTTLGADCGIGDALAMAVLTDDTLEHGPIQALFTRDEETGLSGAFGMKSGFMEGKYLIKLDREDEGEIFVGCAGGANTTVTFNYTREALPAGYVPLRVSVDKLTGGHSGDDINKRRANANKLLARFLYIVWNKYDARLIEIKGGNLHNAIPRDAYAVIAVPSADKENLRVDFNMFTADVEEEFHVEEKTMTFSLESEQNADGTQPEAIDQKTACGLIFALQAVHNGILEMNQDINWLVETSSNLASIRTNENQIVIVSSQRSSALSSRENMSTTFAAAFRLAGAEVETGDGYPGWKPNPKSELLKITVEAYKKLFGKEPLVRAIHAGLECGLFSEKYPGLDMVSFGPTLRGVHSPDERLVIKTVQMVWDHLVEIIKNIK